MLTNLVGDLVDPLVLVGSVLALVPPLEVLLVLKDRLPGAVLVPVVLFAVVVDLATTVTVAVLALLIDAAIRIVSRFNGTREGGDRESGERDES